VAGLATLVLLLLLAGGFGWFIHLASRPAPAPPHADGIVALTGGAERVEAGLRLLAEHQADWLLLSGIGGGTELATLAHRAGLDPAPIAARVTLGRSATTTRGNAMETATWARENHIGSLIVVTAFYHMPRALAELHRAMPGIPLLPYPVLRPDGRRTYPVAARLLLEEYAKYLLAVSGLSAWVQWQDPLHGPRPE
jgi:uncharacterized SAM-binding protein YcdF (DUF218 family)